MEKNRGLYKTKQKSVKKVSYVFFNYSSLLIELHVKFVEFTEHQ